MDAKAVKKCIKNTIEANALISKGDEVVLGLSGGPDSLCLFYALSELRKDLGFGLSCVHVNHMLRGEDADQDQKMVEDLCKEMDIPCFTVKEDCQALAREQCLTFEEAGRQLRYRSFAYQAEKIAAKGAGAEKVKIAVAHNMNDQAETFLFRLLRGAGTDGLSSMQYSRMDDSGFMVIRPLLDVDRESVENYCREIGLKPCIDKTNGDTNYSRNKIRKELIPYLQENYAENIVEKLAKTAEILREDKMFLQEQTEMWLERAICIDGPGLYREVLKEAPKAILPRIIQRAFGSMGLRENISQAHLAQAAAIINGDRASAQVDFPKGYVLQVSYGKVFFEKEGAREATFGTIKSTIIYKEDYSPKNGTAAFDYQKLCERFNLKGDLRGYLEYRSREAGDYISLNVGSKSIQNLFVDMKVPKDKRDNIALVALGNEVLWIPEGFCKARYSQKYGVDSDTREVLLLEIEKGL